MKKTRKLSKTKKTPQTQSTPNNKKLSKNLNYQIILSISLIIISFALSALFYNTLPETIITHWGIEGNPDGFSPKETGLLLTPTLAIAILILLYFIPKLDPLKKNIDLFEKDYHNIILIMTAFLTYIHLITLILNLGFNLDIRQLISPAFALIFYSMGNLMKKAKRNFFIGIRTPWTLNSDNVWEKTHKKASKLFKASAILSLIGIIQPSLSFFFILIPIILTSIGIVIYSYLEYKKEEKQNKNL